MVPRVEGDRRRPVRERNHGERSAVRIHNGERARQGEVVRDATPADKAVIEVPATFVATFASPVPVTPTSTEPATYTAQIMPGLLTVDGVSATGGTKSPDDTTVTSTVNMPASGPVTVAFAGTRPVDAFSTSFTITP